MIPISKYPAYSINKQGEVHSSLSSKLLSSYVAVSGYPTVDLVRVKGDGGNAVSLHRLLAEAFIPNPHNLSEVNHIDGDKLNYSLSNLEWVSASDNVRHAFTAGLTDKKASIPYEDIPSIVAMLLVGYNWSDIQNQYGVSDPSTIRKLLRRDFERKGKLTMYKTLCDLIKKRNIALRSQVVVVKDSLGTSKTYPSINEAARALGINVKAVHSHIGKSYKEWEFSYA